MTEERAKELEAVWERLVTAIADCRYQLKNGPFKTFGLAGVLAILETILEG